LSGKVTCQEFVEYVKVNPQTFGPLMVWQTLFAKYKDPEGGLMRWAVAAGDPKGCRR
jgi:hypothetical protein